MNGMQMPPSPLEAVDTVGDVANQVVSTVPRVVGNVTGAISQAAKSVEMDLATIRNQGMAPPSPGAIVGSVVSGVGHVGGGVFDAVKGAVDGVVATVDGSKSRVDQFIRR